MTHQGPLPPGRAGDGRQGPSSKRKAMEIKKGIPVSHGVAIARAVALDAEEYNVPDDKIPEERVERELARLTAGFDASLAEVDALREATSRQLGQDIGAIFDFHHGVLSQPHLREQVAALIKERRHAAAYAARSRKCLYP